MTHTHDDIKDYNFIWLLTQRLTTHDTRIWCCYTISICENVKSTENITAEASSISWNRHNNIKHPLECELFNISTLHKEQKEIFNIIFPFRLQHTDYEELKYHHVFISYGGFHCSIQFSNLFCQLRHDTHNTQSIHYDFQVSLKESSSHIFILFVLVSSSILPGLTTRLWIVNCQARTSFSFLGEDDGCVKFILIP